jgi:cell division protein FtsW (lipid II flippase)
MRNPYRTERLLLGLAALFIFLYALALSLSAAAHIRSWQVDYRWWHWLGVLIWTGGIAAAHLQANRWLPERDPYLLPLAALLSGWGVLTIWRLVPSVGLRQSLWLMVSITIFILGLRLPRDLGFLRRYKYVWLTSGLLLTALTLFLGTNPLGYGPRLWLGCCGLYFQPSEPLKLLLIVYLAAYLAGKQSPYISTRRRSILPWLGPTLLITGLTMALLLAQRDLGTASIFIFLYVTVVFIASADWRILLFGGLALLLSGVAGYALFDVVRLRVDAWLNPWIDPSGRSYQIVQSLLAVSNGGLFGRGPGLGNPTLVPISHSDFVFAAIAEETGLLGALALLVILATLAQRGLRIALSATDTYRRYLAAGLTAHLVGQSILIIGGNLRLLPLTGVTLPFVSYGGSSLLTSFLSLLLLMHISSNEEESQPAPLPESLPYLGLGAFLLAGLGAASLVSGWWAVYRGPDLLTRSDNARRAIADRYVQRGAILDRHNTPLAATYGEPGEYTRQALYPPLSPVVGYSNPTYGQSGLEAGLDPYLRGLRGNPGLDIWWNYLLYGQPPAGLNVRLSLDLTMQRAADNELGDHTGALVLMNAQSGEILAMATYPTFDANTLEQNWAQLISEPSAPLLNRSVQGRYPTGDLSNLLFPQGAQTPGLDPAPEIYLPAASLPNPGETLILSPLQVALSAAALTARGVQPVPVLAIAVYTPAAGWVNLPPQGNEAHIYTPEAAQAKMQTMTVENRFIWQSSEVTPNGPERFATWYVAGTLPDWSGMPLAIAILLEEDDPVLAEQIGRKVLEKAMTP